MGAPSSTYASALGAACAAVRSDPKLAHWTAVQDVDHRNEVHHFTADRRIAAWLRSLPSRRHMELLADLLAKADEYVYGGQGDRLVSAFAVQRDAGLLEGLSPTRLAVHRAVYSLAVHQGAPLLASMRYIGVAVREQSGITVSPATIRDHVLALVRDRLLLNHLPGRPGIRGESGTIEFELSPEAPSQLDASALAELTLSNDVLLALHEYREATREDVGRRSDAAHARFQRRQSSLLTHNEPVPDDQLKRGRGRPRTLPEWSDAEGRSRAHRDHPIATICRNFRRNAISPVDPSDPYAGRHGEAVHFWLVDRWKDDLAAFTYELADEIGLPLAKHYLIWPKDPRKPVGPGNVEWRLRPKDLRVARREQIARLELAEMLSGLDLRRQLDGSSLPGWFVDELRHAGSCETQRQALEPVECPCTTSEREAHTMFEV